MHNIFVSPYVKLRYKDTLYKEYYIIGFRDIEYYNHGRGYSRQEENLSIDGKSSLLTVNKGQRVEKGLDKYNELRPWLYVIQRACV